MNKDYVLAGVNALRSAYLAQRKLLRKGNIGEFVLKGSGLDRATRGDFESEEAVIKSFQRSGLPIRIFSEEHGQIDIGKNPRYFAVLDGVDGSSAMAANPNTRCGTMVAIATTLDPLYRDFLFGGVTEYSTNRILFGVQGKGSTLIENPGVKETVTSVVPKKRLPLGKDTRIYIDDPTLFEDYKPGITSGLDAVGQFMREKFTQPLKEGGLEHLSAQASGAATSMDFLLGDVDALCLVIAKGVFEPPASYALTRSINGFVLGADGKDIGPRKWSTYGRPMSGVLAVPSRKLGRDLMRLIKK